MSVRDVGIQLAKRIYMTAVKRRVKKASLLPVLNEVAYLLSFPQNNRGLIESLASDTSLGKVVVYYTETCLFEVEAYQSLGIECYSLDDKKLFFKELLARIYRSKTIICDNYFAFMGEVPSREKNAVFQIWHANGAIKTFGWQDSATMERSEADRRRFQRVYDAVDYYVVGSDEMAKVFQASYNISEDRVLKIGCPRTDLFFETDFKKEANEKFKQLFPEYLNKKIALYVPTYRPSDNQVVLDRMAEYEPSKELVVFGHLHPQMKQLGKNLTTQLVFDFRGMTMEEMMCVTDHLITDYSSIPFEYTLANPDGQIHFLCPDLKTYSTTVGLQQFFKDLLVKEAVADFKQVLNAISSDEGLVAKVFGAAWNEYNDGKATERLIKMIKEREG